MSETGSSYGYANSDPVNSLDRIGLATEGYCAGITVGMAGVNVSGTACLVEANGNQQVGWTFSVGGNAGLSVQAISEYLAKHPPSLRLFSASASLSYETSSANKICSLAGSFQTSTDSLSVGYLSASYEHFSGNGVSGRLFSIGGNFGLPTVDVQGNLGTEDTIFAETLTGPSAALAANAITVLNGLNPLHWLAGPLDFYS